MIFNYTIYETIGNKDYTTDYGAALDTILINIDNTPYSDFILGLSAGHGSSLENSKAEVQNSIQQQFPVQKVTVTGGSMTGMTLGDGQGEIDLPRNAFGFDSEFKTEQNQIVSDSVVFLIRKSALAPDVLARFQTSAIPAKNLSFSPITAKDKLFAVCTAPDTKLSTAVAEGARFVGNVGNVTLIGPSLPHQGYSGCAVSEEDQLKGIIVAEDRTEYNYNLESWVIPLNSIGEGNFWSRVEKAAHDPDLGK